MGAVVVRFSEVMVACSHGTVAVICQVKVRVMGG